MNLTREEIAAFVDGELDPARRDEVAAAVAAEPALAEQVRAHRALRRRLSAHFAPILDAPLPERLTAPLHRPRATVVDLATARDRREQRKGRPLRWSWIAAPALAASLALAVLLPRGADEDLANGPLATALERQLVAAQPKDAPHRILLSFRDEGGAYCRAFVGEDLSGIACRERQGWRLRERGQGVGQSRAEYRMAGNPVAAILERAQSMSAGPALDAAEEQSARARGWQ
jgi:hypothetical protein